jgi:hypothetical protein
MKEFMVRDCECCKQYFRIYHKDFDVHKEYRYCTECEQHPKPEIKIGGLYKHDDYVLNGSASHYESERWRREDEEQYKRREFER